MRIFFKNTLDRCNPLPYIEVMENIIEYHLSHDLRRSVTRYDSNRVEVCFVTPTGRDVIVKQETFSSEMGAILYYEFQKGELECAEY